MTDLIPQPARMTPPEPQTPDMVEVKPCPFCGGEASDTGRIQYSRALEDAEWADGSPVTEAFYVNCIRCGAVGRSGIIGGYQTKAEAIAAWNTRREQPAIVGGVDREAVKEALAFLGTVRQAIPDIAAARRVLNIALTARPSAPAEVVEERFRCHGCGELWAARNLNKQERCPDCQDGGDLLSTPATPAPVEPGSERS